MSYLKCPIRWCVVISLLLAGYSASAYTARDVDTMAGAYSSVFYSLSGTNGFIKDSANSGAAGFWTQAEMIESVIDAYEWTSNSVYQGMITNLLNGFLVSHTGNWAGNPFNDDVMWAVLAFARGGALTGRTNYCAIAKANFDMCYARAWDNVVGGGLYWNTDNNTKNACVNGPGSCAASVLYQIYGDTNYYNKATNIYYWERRVLFNTNNGAIADAVGTNGVLNGGATTYNQGTFLGAANFLGETNDAKLAANFTMVNMGNAGIMPQYALANDVSGFNAIYLRWLMRFIKSRNLQSQYQPWLRLNAAAAWNTRRASENVSWCQWQQPTPLSTNLTSWDCVSSYLAMLAADPTQGTTALAVPRDAVGYWPLDATGGTIATNGAWDGNHGTLNGTNWNAGGRLSGCLSFNGTTNYVQLSNALRNDFSISFWAKTTQIAGTGNWYNGAGLVDADVSGGANDFGTALVGGRFAFGIGNPDTTILSTTSINDGAWHHCVATRQQATGTMRVYVDGNLQATGTGTKNTLSAPTTMLFGKAAAGANYFNGSLDEVKLFTRTLSSNEVAALYSSFLVVPTAAPTNLTALASGNARVQLMWSDAPLASSYNVKRSTTAGGPYVTITNVNAVTYTDTNIVNYRTYYYVVAPVNPMGEGPSSAVASANSSALMVWLKADAITGLADGAGVANWSDVSGNGYDALQMWVPYQPKYVTNGINGLPVIRFSPTNTSYLSIYRPVQDDFTITFVYRASQGIGTGGNFWEGAGLISGEQGGTVSDFGVSLNANGQILAGVGNPDKTAASGSGFANGLPHVVSFKRIKSTGVISLYVDGALRAVNTGGTQALTATSFLALGAQGVLNNFLTGDIAEVQIYNAALADADRVAQERALNCKYGLSGGVTPPAPSGLTGSITNRQVVLNWTLSPGASTYNLMRSVDGGGSYDLIAGGLTASSYVDGSPVLGQTNLYQVKGVDACGAGAGSGVVSAFLPLPEIVLSVTEDNALSLSWPDWASDWALYLTTNLTPPVVWEPVTNTVVSSNGQFNVSIPIETDTRFFRLATP